MATVLTDPHSAETATRQTRILIDNRFVDSVSGRTFETINPATGEVLAKVAEADAADVDIAVKAARRAFHSQGPVAQHVRLRARQTLQPPCRSHRKEHRRTRHPRVARQRETASRRNGGGSAAGHRLLPLLRGRADKIQGKTIPINGDYFCYTRHEPVGVVGQIIPWNFPLLMQAWKLGPRWLRQHRGDEARRTNSPQRTSRGELILEAGFPDGVVNILPGLRSHRGRRHRRPHGRR